ncbi:ExeA family protein [Methylomusa anaerophila]
MIRIIKYAAQRQWFAVVTGDCGTGKTTTIRRFKALLDPAKFSVMYLADSQLTPRHFYKGLLEQLGCESKFYRGDAKRQLHREIELLQGIHHLSPVVIADEVHLLDKEMLEEVRFLLNFRMDAQSPMALILVGQMELWERLQLQAYAAIRQRIDLQCKLSYYDRAQVGEYINQHLSFAGAAIRFFQTMPLMKFFGFPAALLALSIKHVLIVALWCTKRPPYYRRSYG